MDFALTISTDIRQPLLLTVKSNLMSGFECQTYLGSGRIDIPVQLPGVPTNFGQEISKKSNAQYLKIIQNVAF